MIWDNYVGRLSDGSNVAVRYEFMPKIKFSVIGLLCLLLFNADHPWFLCLDLDKMTVFIFLPALTTSEATKQDAQGWENGLRFSSETH